MNEYYISLCRGLTGYYVLVLAESEEVVRQHAVEYFGKIWCNIYSSAYFREVICKRYPGASRVVNRSKPIDLSGGPSYE